MIDADATLFAGMILLGIVLGLWLYEIASGEDGGPYGLLAAITGLAYIAGVIWGRFRSQSGSHTSGRAMADGLDVVFLGVEDDAPC